MTKVLSASRFSLVLAAPLAVLAFAGPPSAALAAGPPKSVAATLQRFIDDGTIAGAVVLVADKEKVLDLDAIGYSDLATRKRMETTDLFYIASMTKTFTTVALMMLVEEGKVNLDNPVEKYLPEFRGQMVEEQGRPQHLPKHPITVREIMSHTAALHKGPFAGDSLERLVQEIARRPLECEPGTQYKYSAGPAVAGRIVEVVSGIPYTQFLQERILAPLGLKDTTFWPNDALGARLALTHRLDPATRTLIPLAHDPLKGTEMPPRVASQMGGSIATAYRNHFGNPAGGLFSTANDIGKFCQMLLNDGTFQSRKYLSAASVREMSGGQTGKLAVGRDEGYGLGCFVQQKAKPGGPSVGSFGHHGARKTQMWIDPQNQLVMVLMVQCSELTHLQQDDLYSTYRQQAIGRYGKSARHETEGR